MAGLGLHLLSVLLASAAIGASSQSLCPLDCPFGFACISADGSGDAACLPINPCDIADCGEGFICDLLFTEDQCNPIDTQSDIICAPIAVCKADSEGQNSQCGTSNPCQGSFQLGFFQLCVEQLEDTEACFAGEYGPIEECDTFEACLNPPTPPSSCDSVSCPGGLVCAESLVDPQGCAQSPIYEGIEECNKKAECVFPDPCLVVTCPDNSECVVAFDPMEECLGNSIDECPSVAQCVPLPSPCDSVSCPFGFTCIAPSADSEAKCLPLNPCDLTDCGDGFFCELIFTPEQCNPAPFSGPFPCAPLAKCSPDGQPTNSICILEPCQQQSELQLCVEQLESPQNCFDGLYGDFEFCDAFEDCIDIPQDLSCSAATCEGGLVCSTFLADPQGCAQSPIYEGIDECNKDSACIFPNPCDVALCPMNTDCVVIFDPTEECISNDIGECPTIAQCQPFVDPCDTVDCPFGFTCIANDSSDTAKCLPLNPCLTADCPDGFFCDLVFSLEQCKPFGSSGSFTCAPTAVCRDNSLPTASDCGPSNSCQGDFQLCAEELDDPEACFTGAYETPEQCGTTFVCLNPPSPVSGCDSLTCEGGLTCVESLLDPQGCFQSPVYEGIDECKTKAECVLSDPCTVTECPIGFECIRFLSTDEECLSDVLDECPTVATCLADCPEAVPGDADGDGVVNVSDIVLTVNFILGSGSLDNCAAENVDLNSSGSVDVADVVLQTGIILGDIAP